MHGKTVKYQCRV